MAGDLHARLSAFSPTLEPCTPKAPRGLDDVHEEEVAFCVRARVLARVHVLCASAARLSPTRPPSRGSRPAWPVGLRACMVCVCGGRPDMVTVLTGRPTLSTTLVWAIDIATSSGRDRPGSSRRASLQHLMRCREYWTGSRDTQVPVAPGWMGGNEGTLFPMGVPGHQDVGAQRIVCCAYCLQLLGWPDWPVRLACCSVRVVSAA